MRRPDRLPGRAPDLGYLQYKVHLQRAAGPANAGQSGADAGSAGRAAQWDARDQFLYLLNWLVFLLTSFRRRRSVFRLSDTLKSFFLG